MDLLYVFIIIGLAVAAMYIAYNWRTPARTTRTEEKLDDQTHLSVPTATPVVITPVTEPVPVEKTTVVESVLDVNKDGKVDLADVKEAVKKTRGRAKKVLDQDGDGKVTVKDAKIAATKVKTRAKTVATKAKKTTKLRLKKA